jgi:exoribonuclease II
MFTIPFLVHRDAAIRCGMDQIATKKSEVLARVEVLKRIRDLERSVEHAYNVIGSINLSLYAHVKSPNPNEWSEITVTQAVPLLCPRADPASPTTILAVHKYLMMQPKYYVADPTNYAASQTFAVRPQSHIDEIEAIDKMRIEGRRAAFKTFGLKSQKIIADNRKRAAESRNEPPSEVRGQEVVYSDDDLVILSFLLNACRPTRSIQSDPYSLGVASILKHIDKDIPQIHGGVLHQVLIDLGVLPQWADMVSRKRDLGLDQCSEADSPRVKAQNALVTKALSAPRTSPTNQPLGPEDLYPTDMAESIRHDFGNMPVYVLDDGHAEELDDGISIESIPSEPTSAWVHVHIADPTSILPPEHVFAQQARNQLETRYFIHRTWPMLPHLLLRKGLSLGTGTQGAERVLTFSFKINGEGEMVGYNVRPGIVRNLHIIPYDAADHAVVGKVFARFNYPFGGGPDPTPPSPSIELDQVHLKNLRALKSIADLLIAHRLRSPAFNADITARELTMSSKLPSQDYHPSATPTFFRGFPNLTYGVLDSRHSNVGCRQMVAELMRLACWAASRWCSDRDVPVVRRWAPPYLVPSSANLPDLLALRSATGYVDYGRALRYEIIIPPAQYTLEPKGHWSIAIPEGEGYLRVTSPLRRYADMLAHWQINYSLLNKKLPFSMESLQRFIDFAAIRSRMQRREDIRHQTFWALQFIRRWMEDPRRREDEDDPLQSLVGIPFNLPLLNFTTKEFVCGVRLQALGIEALLFVKEKEDIRIGEEVNVRIKEIVLGNEAQMVVVKR